MFSRTWRAAHWRAETATLANDIVVRALRDTLADPERAAVILTPASPADVAALAVMSLRMIARTKGSGRHGKAIQAASSR